MPHNLSGEFGFTLDFDPVSTDLDYGYDPLADSEDDDEEEADDTSFTAAPVASLSEPPQKAPAEGESARADENRPASERIEETFAKLNPRRRVLAGILRYLDEPHRAEDLDAKVEELQRYDFSVYTAANYASLLEEAGAIEKTDENGIPMREAPEQSPETVEIDGVEFLKPAPWRDVYWRATDDARAYLAKDDPLARFKDLLANDAKYLDIYLRILDAAAQEGGAATPDLNAMVDNDPLVQSPRLFTAHFTELLERCEAVRWEGAWKITEIGSALLDGRIECPTDSPAVPSATTGNEDE